MLPLIDTDAKVVQGLSGQLPHVAGADSTDIEALRQLGITDFNRAVVASAPTSRPAS